MNSLVERVLEQPMIYRLWQATHGERKFAPVLAHNDLGRVRRVLDVGCGPGMSTRFFARSDYLGIDINPSYIAEARRRWGRPFVVADATTYAAPAGERYDFILVNSFLHHIDRPEARRVLGHLAGLLTEDGHLHSIEPVMPDKPGLQRLLARCDRGKYWRPMGKWRELFGEFLDPVVFELFPVTVLWITCWQLVYFKGRAKR
ncbi:MAG TPA: class I SAM-dependent methyltransferase [Candidatus Acidoferrales bacterium]|nr:class I SAM-dependent methyltransferase [Candidatus Acidoferrales bacterium]